MQHVFGSVYHGIPQFCSGLVSSPTAEAAKTSFEAEFKGLRLHQPLLYLDVLFASASFTSPCMLTVQASESYHALVRQRRCKGGHLSRKTRQRNGTYCLSTNRSCCLARVLMTLMDSSFLSLNAWTSILKSECVRLLPYC